MKAIWKKGLAAVVVIVFLNLALVSVINTANRSPLKIEEKNYENNGSGFKEMQEDFIEAEITEYDSNGIEKRIVSLPMVEVEKLKNKLMEAETMEEKFCVLQQYGLISQKSSMVSWEREMYEKAEKMGLLDGKQNITPKYEAMGIFNLPILLNFLCKVNAIYILSGNARLGLPPIIGFTKFFGGSRILSFDLIDMCWGAFGVLETKGLLRNHALTTIPSFMCLAGFVGIHIHIPMILDLYNGFSAMTFAIGLGLHSINFNLVTAALLGFVLGGAIAQLIFGSTGSES